MEKYIIINLSKEKLTILRKSNGKEIPIQKYCSKAYQYLEIYPIEVFQKLTCLLSKTAIEVCEGQQYDIDFESRTNTTKQEYIKMIRLKTGVLLGCALKMGAIIGGANEEDQQAIYDFGIQLGLAFQLQDDYLDTFGDQNTFGKKSYEFSKNEIFYRNVVKKNCISLMPENAY